MIRLLLIPLLALSLSAPASATDDPEVHQAVTRFLTAFENLDLPAFMACFADNATVFFPAPEPPDRFDGKAAIEQHFATVFAAIRASSATGRPPYHALRPQDLQVSMLGPHAAVVTFHLRNAQRIARRTLVLEKVKDRWLIQHLHASNQSLAPS